MLISYFCCIIVRCRNITFIRERGMKRKIKVFAVILSSVLLLGGCSSISDFIRGVNDGLNSADDTETGTQQVTVVSEFSPDAEEGASITSRWIIESVTTRGETTYIDETYDEDKIPKFISKDGKTFTLTIMGEKYYNGELIPQEDGTYQLKHGDNENILIAEIAGDKLVITTPKGSLMTFKLDE